MQQHEYHGLCSICGQKGIFSRGDERSIREGYPCPSCRFTLRWRDQAGVIVDEFGRGRALSIEELVKQHLLDDVAIFETAMRGPFVTRLRGLPNYTQSYFWPDVALGAAGPTGLRNEDLTDLTFPDDVFDLVITSDVMEHLYDIEGAFAEILRVLKPGGVHVFTIPNSYPMPERTEKRVGLKNGVELHLKEPRYHNSGDGTPCLVYTDYGADVVDLIRRLGGQTGIVRRSGAIDPCYMNATFVTRKLGGGRASAGWRAGARSSAHAPAPAVAPQAPAEPELTCPVCGGHAFEAFNGRTNARCSRCRSVERNRLMFMVLDKLDAFKKGQRILHIAPESGLGRRFHALSGDAYHPGDIDAARYESHLLKVKPFDLCKDVGGVPDESYDVIVHSHVLEHIACDVHDVLHELDRILARGGLHIMSVPIRGETTKEDLSAELSETHRLMMFGQGDHMRIFGSKSLTEMLSDVWGAGDHLVEPAKLFSEAELRRAGIPPVAWSGITSHSLFCYRKGADSVAGALAEPAISDVAASR